MSRMDWDTSLYRIPQQTEASLLLAERFTKETGENCM